MQAMLESSQTKRKLLTMLNNVMTWADGLKFRTGKTKFMTINHTDHFLLSAKQIIKSGQQLQIPWLPVLY